MMMIAAVALTSANAGNISWNTGDLRQLWVWGNLIGEGPEREKLSGATVFADHWVGQNAYFFLCTAGCDMSAVVAVLSGGGSLADVTALTGVIKQVTFNSTPTINGAYPPGGSGANPDNMTDYYTSSTYYYGFSVIFDKSGDFVAISSTAKATNQLIPVGASQATWNAGAASTAGAWGVYQIIPEPATGLLALAGIGMLIAQKRKRA